MGLCIAMQGFSGCETVALEVAVHMKSDRMARWSRFESYLGKYDDGYLEENGYVLAWPREIKGGEIV